VHPPRHSTVVPNDRRRAIATVSLRGSLEEKLSVAASAGFDGVEIFENDLIASSLTPAQVRRRVDELGLEIVLYQPFRDLEGVTSDVFARNLRRADCKLTVMEELGADLLLVCSNVAPDAIDDDSLAASQLHALAERAAPLGMRIAYEALAWGTHVKDYMHSWRIVEAADHPALGLCLDSFHILSRGDDARGVRAIPSEKIFFLQLADAPQLLMDVLQWSRHYRCFPGQGAFDLPTFVAQVLAAGYNGPLSLEVFNDVFRQASPEGVATDAMRSLLALEEAVDPAASGLPPPARLDGYSFLELTVDGMASEHVARVLDAMGFRHADGPRGESRGLWHQGSIRIAVHRQDYAQEPGDVLISTIGLASVDPDRSAQRAVALHAPLRHAESGRPPEIVAPDGTWIALCDAAEASEDLWSDDFALPVDAAVAGLLTHVDHIALSQPFDSFDEATLFYRSVLGLETHASQELAAPHGLVRSRALTTVDGSVRIALNVPLLGSGSTSLATIAQHVAFACEDIVTVARAMRENGASFLPIPGNYYDDLVARLEIDDERLATLRELDVLYDRNADGEFLHFFTPIIGWRLFLEVVQRVGGYNAFGAANSAVRLAAHRGEFSRPAELSRREAP
jgi:4-hydroxyphenylpyruvate dioxygenase